jgi:hypothetical protein
MIDARARRDRIAQWAFDARPVLGRFHLWLEDVEESRVEGEAGLDLSFAGTSLEKCLIMTAGVTALGTRLFGRYGEAKGLDAHGANHVKKDADAVSAYAMSEGLWYLTRSLPENHAIMVSLGEGLMPKGGETPDMGSNPLLGFGRVYARPSVARWLDARVHRFINDASYGWRTFWSELMAARITVWGAAIDTLENTSRFAKGAPTGPTTVLHLFDQPLRIARPYEGYTGALTLPKEVHETAADSSILLDFLTPRALVLDAIRKAYPGLEPGDVHVWTLAGPTRVKRIGKLWDEWKALGAHLVEDGWTLPSGLGAFTDSGTYAPTYQVGPFRREDGRLQLFITDGYAASAEALQAASLDPILGNRTSMCVLTSRFEVSYERERQILFLDPASPDFPQRLSEILEREVTPKDCLAYAGILTNARDAAMPLGKRTVTADDFFQKKEWHVLSLMGSMLPEPYTGLSGVEEAKPGVYRVTTRAASERGVLDVTLTLRLMESFDQTRLVFSPLLDRFYRGQDWKTRPVKVSDSGRIRNELQTLASEALEYFGENGIRVHFDRVDDAVLAPDKKALIREVLAWYKEHHPIWFGWLELT